MNAGHFIPDHAPVESIFDRMLDIRVRQAFIERKENSYNTSEQELDELRSFLFSPDCVRDILRLREGDFYFEPPQLTKLRKKNSDRRRNIYRFTRHESMILKLMAFVLHDYDHLFSDSLYSFRIGRSISRIFRTLKRKGYGSTHWVIKTDISSFGDHLIPEIASEQIRRLLYDEQPLFCEFVSFLLERGLYYDHGTLCHGSTGALSGCALTNFFENVYLLDLDRFLIDHSTFYCRYTDDIAVFVETEEEASGLYRIIEEHFTALGLTFNQEKTHILPPGSAFDLLGFRLDNGEYDIADNSMEKIEWKLRHYARKLVRRQQRGRISAADAGRLMVNRINKYFFGREREDHELNWVDWAFSVLTRPDSLKRLDACAQECIRYVGSGGKKTDAKYRVRYKHMRRMGYRPLVHAYYHGYSKL